MPFLIITATPACTSEDLVPRESGHRRNCPAFAVGLPDLGVYALATRTQPDEVLF